jgi:hypothetical protein
MIVSCFDRDFAARRHGIARVDGPIEKSGFQQVRIGFNLP